MISFVGSLSDASILYKRPPNPEYMRGCEEQRLQATIGLTKLD